MKPTTIIFIVLYLALFTLAGVWAYFKYFRTTPTVAQTEVITLDKNKTILYAKGNNLYQLAADNANRDSQDINTSRLQSTGRVQSIVLDPKNEFFIYDCINPSNTSEIWQVSLKDNHSEKIFSSATPGFETYTNFRSPKMSKSSRQLAFVASNQSVDDIFVWNVDKKTTQNVTLKSIKEKITAFDWSKTESKIFLAVQSNDKMTLKSLGLDKKSSNLFEGVNQITDIEALKDKMIVTFLDSNEIANLGYITLNSPKNIIPITDLKTPSTIVTFNLSLDGKKIVYQTQNNTLKTNDLYIVGTDGTNLLQLSLDGKSFSPIFSPDGKKIAFYLQNSGIYTMGIFKDNLTKILNEEEKINNLLIWR